MDVAAWANGSASWTEQVGMRGGPRLAPGAKTRTTQGFYHAPESTVQRLGGEWPAEIAEGRS
jgi:hypothetical protein